MSRVLPSRNLFVIRTILPTPHFSTPPSGVTTPSGKFPPLLGRAPNSHLEHSLEPSITLFTSSLFPVLYFTSRPNNETEIPPAEFGWARLPKSLYTRLSTFDAYGPRIRAQPDSSDAQPTARVCPPHTQSAWPASLQPRPPVPDQILIITVPVLDLPLPPKAARFSRCALLPFSPLSSFS